MTVLRLPPCFPALQMRFPERVLRVKAESAEEAETWEASLQKAHMMKVHGDTTAKAKVLQSPKVRSVHACTWRMRMHGMMHAWAQHALACHM